MNREAVKRLLKLSLSALFEVHQDVVEKGVDLKRTQTRHILFRKLCAVFYGVNSMILALGFSDADVAKELRRLNAEGQKAAGTET